MFQPIQLVLATILIFAISRVYLKARQGSLAPGEILFWISIFSAAVLGVVDPSFTNFVANKLGIGRGADVVIYISLVLLFYLIFRVNVMIEDLRHEITKLVRELALQKKTKSK